MSCHGLYSHDKILKSADAEFLKVLMLTPRHSTKNSRRKLAVWMLITAMAVWLGDMSGVDPAKKQNRSQSVGLRYPIDILDANMRILSI